MSTLLEPAGLDLFGEPLRPPTRRERQRVAVAAPRVRAASPGVAPRVLPGLFATPPPAAPCVPAPSLAPACSAAPHTLHPQLWRAAELGQASARCCPSGFARLDAALPGGGWPTRGLTEILLPPGSHAEWRLLAPALATRARAAQRLLLIGPPYQPHPRGLAAWGLGAAQCLWLAVDEPLQRLWALEQALKADADDTGALLAWLPQVRPQQLRRLQTLALGCRAPVFVLRPAAQATAVSAAPLRLRVLPGAHWAQLRVEILKRRGPALERPLRLHAPPPTLEAVLMPWRTGLSQALLPPEDWPGWQAGEQTDGQAQAQQGALAQSLAP
jgi:protein ImuA